MASLDTLMPLTLFTFVAAVTPGPNNVMLIASGVNFGFRRTIPHMAGIVAGFFAMAVLTGLGLAGVLKQAPVLLSALKYGGAAYLLWLAWKIANAGPVEGGDAAGEPMTLLQAAMFQWVNPKGWMMLVTALATYSVTENHALNGLIVALVFSVVSVPAIALWAAFGSKLRAFLADPGRLRLFNLAMALLLVASLAPLLAEFLS